MCVCERARDWRPTLVSSFTREVADEGADVSGRDGESRRWGGGGVASGEVKWTEGKMDRELDLPNLPPR